MARFADNPFDGALAVVTTLRDRHIEASLVELRKRDEMTLALREFLRNGVDINSLSEASGLTIEDILRRVDGELHLIDDTADLVGSR